jgi:hypothetical protein
MVPELQVTTVCFWYSPADLNSLKLSLHYEGHYITCLSKLFTSPYINQKTKIPLFLSESIICHPNIYIFILSLSEGRAGEVWVYYNKVMLFPPPPPLNKVFHPVTFSLQLFLTPIFLQSCLSPRISFNFLQSSLTPGRIYSSFLQSYL